MMNRFGNLNTDSAWPTEDLEDVGGCPFCASTGRTVAYEDVEDWTFEAAPGRWTYWDCTQCGSLYLDPRPTEQSIWSAYDAYYTHNQTSKGGGLQRLKRRLLNECWSHWLKTEIRPRLGLPRILAPLLTPLRPTIPPPFELEVLAELPKGELLDVGCGSGVTLRLAALLGWRATGLELDPAAVHAARADGLDVIQGSYRKLEEHPGRWDYIICSHVLEHVHHPLDLLELIDSALTSSGVAIISCPNSQSYVRKRFGSSWRGLEAPRHLAIPSLDVLVDRITSRGFSVTEIPPIGSTTIKGSREILQSRRRRHVQADQSLQQLQEATHPPTGHSNPDLIQLVCRKSPTGTAH